VSIEEFEQQVMRALLAGEDPLLETLRKQYAAAVVRDREVNATGFVTRFEIPAGAPLIDRKLLHLDDLQVELEGTRSPVDASVHVHNGKLRSLECFVYDGTFPTAPAIESAWYYGTKKYTGITAELLAERDVAELLEDEDE
jgi:hypothetical protein